MSRRAAVVAGALGFFFAGHLLAEVQEQPSGAGSLTDSRRTPQGLSNDNCEYAIPIFDGNTDFDTTDADTDGLPHASCQSNGQAYHDVWYHYQATCTGELTVSTCCQASYPNELMVYDGCYDDTPCPPTDVELLGCSEESPGCDWRSSQVAVGVVEGHCYTVRVGGQNEGHAGAGTVTLTCDTTFCGDRICGPDENECDCPADCPAGCPCVLFDNRMQFESFNEDQGQILKGIENFEESVQPPGSVDLFDDPLCGGVPNLPDGYPFPNGLEQLSLCVQSNLGGGEAPVPNPRGVDGLAAASLTFLAPASDIVLANFFEDSLDLIFDPEDNHTGVGFDTLTILGGNNVHISVFGKNNTLVLTADSPANPDGSQFWGVWCSSAIGRINIFDTCNGAEGGDNIQMWFSGGPCGECPTDVDGSGGTGAADLAVLLGTWGPCAPGWVCACLDANDDGMIGAEDLAVLLGAWGPCE